jgi:hypothetical protein
MEEAGKNLGPRAMQNYLARAIPKAKHLKYNDTHIIKSSICTDI